MKNINDENSSLLLEIKNTWPKLNLVERFEYVISMCVMLMIAIIVIIALIRLGKNIYSILVINALDPLEFRTFQQIFGNILTLFIAMEFMYSIESVLHRTGNLIVVRIILLIAMLAISRKFIVMDSKLTSPETMIALAVVLFSLGIVYWLVSTGDERVKNNL